MSEEGTWGAGWGEQVEVGEEGEWGMGWWVKRVNGSGVRSGRGG